MHTLATLMFALLALAVMGCDSDPRSYEEKMASAVFEESVLDRWCFGGSRAQSSPDESIVGPHELVCRWQGQYNAAQREKQGQMIARRCSTDGVAISCSAFNIYGPYGGLDVTDTPDPVFREFCHRVGGSYDDDGYDPGAEVAELGDATCEWSPTSGYADG